MRVSLLLNDPGRQYRMHVLGQILKSRADGSGHRCFVPGHRSAAMILRREIWTHTRPHWSSTASLFHVGSVCLPPPRFHVASPIRPPPASLFHVGSPVRPPPASLFHVASPMRPPPASLFHVASPMRPPPARESSAGVWSNDDQDTVNDVSLIATHGCCDSASDE